MLDAFKNITSGKGKLVQQQSEELEQLIATAREERSAISAMLTSLTTRSAKLTPLGKSLEQVSEKASSVTAMLDEIAKRLSALDERTKELEEIDKRIETLKESAKQAEQTTQKALGPDGELQKHREAVQHLSSQALGTQATLDTLKKERATLEELRGQLQKAEAEVKQSLGQSNTLKSELDQRQPGDERNRSQRGSRPRGGQGTGSGQPRLIWDSFRGTQVSMFCRQPPLGFWFSRV